MATIYKTTNIKLATIDYENYLSALAKWLKQNTINFAYRQKVKLPDFVIGDVCTYTYKSNQTIKKYIKNTCYTGKYVQFTL